MTDPTKARVEHRDATVGAVNFAQRIIEMVAVPYEEEAVVEYRGEFWKESFDRGSFDGLEKRPNRVKAFREHDPAKLVGKALAFHPSRDEGLVAEVRVANTSLGDETLSLASEDMLDVSVGFAARPSDQVLDRQSRTRRIRKAFLDHLAFVAQPAYAGAHVVAVRSSEAVADQAEPLITPNVDEVLGWLSVRSSRIG